jgi:vacuolar protein sorting-associated protein 13A/C
MKISFLEFEYNAQKQQETKMKEVRQVEKLRKEKETQSIIDRKNKNNTFIERMELRIIQNLELSIQNIHIVYEDNINHPFSFGITINSISLHVNQFLPLSLFKIFILLDNNI